MGVVYAIHVYRVAHYHIKGVQCTIVRTPLYMYFHRVWCYESDCWRSTSSSTSSTGHRTKRRWTKETGLTNGWAGHHSNSDQIHVIRGGSMLRTCIQVLPVIEYCPLPGVPATYDFVAISQKIHVHVHCQYYIRPVLISKVDCNSKTDHSIHALVAKARDIVTVANG